MFDGELATSQFERIQQLKGWGLPVSEEVKKVQGEQGCLDYYQAIGKKRPDLAYEIDGVVYKVDDIAVPR